MPPPGVCLNIMNERHKKKGRGSLSNPDKFFDQDYEQLKQYCNINRMRYIDDMFPPDSRSIGNGILEPQDLARVVWRRPGVCSFLVLNRYWCTVGNCLCGQCGTITEVSSLWMNACKQCSLTSNHGDEEHQDMVWMHTESLTHKTLVWPKNTARLRCQV